MDDGLHPHEEHRLRSRLEDVEQALREARSPDVRRLLHEIRASHRARIASLAGAAIGHHDAVELVPAAGFTPAELAGLFTAGYEGYYLPVSLDEDAFSYMASTWDYDLEASRVARDSGEPVGLCMLGRRGEDGWIGGVGVVAGRRGRGIGRQLMDAVAGEAARLGVKRLWLEVLVQNEPAIALYDALGYRRVRELEVWTLEPLAFQKHSARAVEASVAHERIQAARREREPWQRADESLANLEGAEGLVSDRAAVVFRLAGDRVSLLQAVAEDDASARSILQGFPAAATTLSWLNGPAGDPFNRALDSLGGTCTARQHEMVLEL